MTVGLATYWQIDKLVYFAAYALVKSGNVEAPSPDDEDVDERVLAWDALEWDVLGGVACEVGRGEI